MMMKKPSIGAMVSLIKCKTGNFSNNYLNRIILNPCWFRMKLFRGPVGLMIFVLFIQCLSAFAVETKQNKFLNARHGALVDKKEDLKPLPAIHPRWTKEESESSSMSSSSVSSNEVPERFSGKIKSAIQKSKYVHLTHLKVDEFPAPAFPVPAAACVVENFETTYPSNLISIASVQTFLSVGIHPNLGQGWIDPEGVIWYDFAVDGQTQNPLELTQIEAHRFCLGHRMRLPKTEDFKKLRLYLSTRSDAQETERFLNLRGYRYWTSSISTLGSLPQGIIFDGNRKKFSSFSPDSKHHVRCILGGR